MLSLFSLVLITVSYNSFLCYLVCFIQDILDAASFHQTLFLYVSHFMVVSFPFRSSSSDDGSVTDASEEPQLTEERLTKEEWQAINKLLSYQPDEESNLPSGKEMQNMVQFLVNISIGQAAARIISMNQTEIVCGRFEQLAVTTKFRQRSILCDVSLKFYGLNAPEGSLAQV